MFGAVGGICAECLFRVPALCGYKAGERSGRGPVERGLGLAAGCRLEIVSLRAGQEFRQRRGGRSAIVIVESCIAVVVHGAQFEQRVAVSDKDAFAGGGELQPSG